MIKRWWNRPCWNCDDPSHCLCVTCVRAIIVSAVVTAVITVLVNKLIGG